ncbi:MAG: insulinase family protein, partial [Anoxybacillus sp.]|nr:insulinase family protein [Anoxybacillus sp.]
MIQEHVTTMQGVRVHLLPTDKYKTTTLVFKFKAPLTKETVTMRALLPYVWQSGTATYPSMKALRTYLDDLYGATLNVDLMKKGEYHVMTIRLDVANEKFLSEQTSLLHQAISLLSDIVLRPALENGRFVSQIVEQEKRALKQRIQS